MRPGLLNSVRGEWYDMLDVPEPLFRLLICSKSCKLLRQPTSAEKNQRIRAFFTPRFATISASSKSPLAITIAENNRNDSTNVYLLAFRPRQPSLAVARALTPSASVPPRTLEVTNRHHTYSRHHTYYIEFHVQRQAPHILP